VQEARIIEQLEKMVASGRITPEEAARIRAAAGTTEFDTVMGDIRVRHAQVHTDAAVKAGRMSQQEADASLDRVRNGEHAGELRSRIRGTR
jgi:polyhydroxyalkanoate synthesis regulator phasin